MGDYTPKKEGVGWKAPHTEDEFTTIIPALQVDKGGSVVDPLVETVGMSVDAGLEVREESTEIIPAIQPLKPFDPSKRIYGEMRVADVKAHVATMHPKPPAVVESDKPSRGGILKTVLGGLKKLWSGR